MDWQPKKIILIIICVLLGALALVSVISLTVKNTPVPSPSPTPTKTAQTPTPTQSKKQDLRIAIYSEPKIIDPHYAQTNDEKIVAAQVFDSIYQANMNDYTNLLPVLVTGYEKSSNNRTYTFTIKQGINFHNGDVLTVDDIVYSIERQKNSEYTQETLIEIAKAEKVDDSRFSVTFKTGFETNLGIMADIRVVNKKLCETYEPGSPELAVGTGAYKIAHRGIEAVELSAVDKYHMSVQPYFKTVKFMVFSDRANAIDALNNGSIDIITNCTVQEYDGAKDNDELRITTLKTNTIHYISINSFDQDIFFVNRIDKDIRKAINYALDRSLINKNANNQTGYTAEDLLIPNTMTGYTQDTAKYQYNVQFAKNQIEYAGYSNGISLSLIYKKGEYWQKVAQSIKDCLAKSNIRLKLEQLSDEEFDQRINSRSYELALQEYAVSSRNPYFVHYELFHSKGRQNKSGIFNEKIDERIETAGTVNSAEKARSTLEEVQKTVRDEAYYAPLYTLMQSEIADKHVAGNIGSPQVGINYIYLMYWDEEALWYNKDSLNIR